METTSELVVNKIEHDNVVPFKKDTLFRGYLEETNSDYNTAFWLSYNAIVPTGVFGKALKDLQKKQSLEEQFKTKN